MAKKILSIFAIVAVLFGIMVMGASIVKAAAGVDCKLNIANTACTNAAGNGNGFCATLGQICQFSAGTLVPLVNPACDCSQRFVPSGVTECIKVGSDFKMKLTSKDGTTHFVTRIESGAIVATQKADTTNCSQLKGTETIVADCDVADVDDSSTKLIGKDAKCILQKPSEIGMIGMLSVVYTVTRWIFYILTLVAILMIIYGGFVYITAAGDPAKATSGKGILTFAIIGLAIALLAKFIPSLVRFILGV